MLIAIANVAAFFGPTVGMNIWPVNDAMLGTLTKNTEAMTALDVLYDSSFDIKRENDELNVLISNINNYAKQGKSDEKNKHECEKKINQTLKAVQDSKVIKEALGTARQSIEKVVDAVYPDWNQELARAGLQRIFDMHGNCFWVSKWYYDNCEKITDPRTGKRMYHTQSGFRVEKNNNYEGKMQEQSQIPIATRVLTDDSDNNTFVESKVSSINVPPLPNETYDVFLSHDWGKFEDDDGTMIQNHDRVKRVNKMLQRYNIQTWFDESNMCNNVNDAMTHAIDRSTCILVFITKNYIKKVDGTGPNGEADNCRYEFQYASNRKIQKHNMLIPIVMDPECWNTKEWVGQVGMKLGCELYYDLSNVDLWNENDESSCEKFVKEVEKIVKAIYAKVSLNGDTMVNPIASGSGINVIRALTPRSKNR